MPLLVILTVGIAIYSVTLPGAGAGLVYYLKPDFHHFSLKTVVAAMGQLFYSMSLAMGTLIGALYHSDIFYIKCTGSAGYLIIKEGA